MHWKKTKSEVGPIVEKGGRMSKEREVKKKEKRRKKTIGDAIKINIDRFGSIHFIVRSG
jgi:hypothetical protein